MQKALADMKNGEHPGPLLDFPVLQEIVGFNAYYENEKRYAADESFDDTKK